MGMNFNEFTTKRENMNIKELIEEVRRLKKIDGSISSFSDHLLKGIRQAVEAMLTYLKDVDNEIPWGLAIVHGYKTSPEFEKKLNDLKALKEELDLLKGENGGNNG